MQLSDASDNEQCWVKIVFLIKKEKPMALSPGD